ncbi:MAG: hypothetical protein AABZ14_03420 [Candidatus Margulisiibacteriota bacterium]
MIYSALEKAAIVLSLMGPELTESILTKLSREIVSTLQKDVLPLIDQIQIPEDIDAFVFQEIIQPSQESEPEITQEVSEEKISEPISPEQEEIPPETTWEKLSDEELCEQIDVECVMKCLSSENIVFQPLLLALFSSQKQAALLDRFKELELTIQSSSQKATLSTTISTQICQAFVNRLRNECQNGAPT